MLKLYVDEAFTVDEAAVIVGCVIKFDEIPLKTKLELGNDIPSELWSINVDVSEVK